MKSLNEVVDTLRGHGRAQVCTLEPKDVREIVEVIDAHMSHALKIIDENQRMRGRFEPDCDRECSVVLVKAGYAQQVKHSAFCRHSERTVKT